MMLIKADGSHSRLDVDPTDEAMLHTLQTAVGGWIEVVACGPNVLILSEDDRPIVCGAGVLVVNEEGLLRGLPRNPFASHLAGQAIVGDAVYCDAETYERWPKE